MFYNAKNMPTKSCNQKPGYCQMGYLIESVLQLTKVQEKRVNNYKTVSLCI